MSDSGSAKILDFQRPQSNDGPAVQGEVDRIDAVQQEHVRLAEAMLFASDRPVTEAMLASQLPEGACLPEILESLKQFYAGRGVNLVKVGPAWAFRTADDLGFLLHKESVHTKKLSKAAYEVLAIIAYHQPVTRAEIEEVRGVATSKGTLDVLMESGWIKMRGRRRVPGRPITYGTTLDFLDQFGLEEIGDLPGLDEIKGAGFLQSQLPANFSVPLPDDSPDLDEDEDPLSAEDIESFGILPPLAKDD